MALILLSATFADINPRNRIHIMQYLYLRHNIGYSVLAERKMV